jgi:hypothetical protein
MKNKSDVIDFGHSTICIEDGIIRHTYSKNPIKIDLAKQLVKDRLTVCNGVIRPALIDIRNMSTIDKESRQYLASQEAVTFLSATALLAENFLTKITGNIFMTFEKHLVPTKLFTDENEALEWLQQFKDIKQVNG